MPRKPLYRSSDLPYHLYNRSIDGLFYPLATKELWNVCSDLMRLLCWAFGVRIHAFVLMNNHYHLLASTPDRNVDEALRYFQSQFSKYVCTMAGEQKFRFCGRYKACILPNVFAYRQVYRYILLNPVRAGICQRAEDYRWSTLGGQLGHGRLDIPISPHDWDGSFPPVDSDDYLEFLHGPLSLEELEQTRHALKRSEYKITDSGYGVNRKSALTP